MRIGKRALDDLARRWAAARDNGGPVARDILWDDEIPGFGVRRQTTGSGCTYVLKFRVKGVPRQRFVSLGEWPAVHPDAARDEARRIKEAAAFGRDLLAERAVDRAAAAAEVEEARRRAIPLSEILDAWRAAIEVVRARKLAEGRSAVTEREYLRLEAVRLRPFLAGQTVGSFDPDSLQALLDRASGASAALNLRSLLSRFLAFARPWLVERGIRVDWRRRFEITQEKRPPRDHRYTLEEAAALWIGAGRLGRRGALVRMLLLTGLRRSEVARLRWSQAMLEDAVLGAYLELPAVAVKHRRLVRQPLSAAAVALLRWLPARESRRFGDADLVFAGRGNRPVGGWTDVRRALLKAARVPDGTLHDIRRTIVSTLADHGWEPAVVDRVLNHAAAATMPGVMAVYQRSELWEQKRRALEAWAEILLGEVARSQRQPLDREAWGLTAPFEEARIRRPRARRAQSQPA